MIIMADEQRKISFNSIDENGEFLCSICGKIFQTKRRLAHHLQNHLQVDQELRKGIDSTNEKKLPRAESQIDWEKYLVDCIDNFSFSKLETEKGNKYFKNQWALRQKLNRITNDNILLKKENSILKELLSSRNIDILTTGLYLNSPPVKNELGVIFRFAILYKRLGFSKITTIRSQFPDCIAIRDGKQVRIEFENEV